MHMHVAFVHKFTLPIRRHLSYYLRHGAAMENDHSVKTGTKPDATPEMVFKQQPDMVTVYVIYCLLAMSTRVLAKVIPTIFVEYQ